jgi:hypothetical protein
MQVFPREVTDYIAEQLTAYFQRKQDRRMSVRDAAAMIDFVSGPAPSASGGNTTDFSKPRVSGGGKVRPTEQRIEGIVRKYIAEESEWDAVFDRLIRQCREHDAVKLIHYVFRDGKREAEVCEALHISRPTYYNYRSAILNRAVAMATASGILDI